MKKIVGLLLVLLLVLCEVGTTFAEVDTSKQQSQLDAINSEKSQLQKELNNNKTTKKNLNSEIRNLEGKIAMSNLEIQELGVSISLTQAKITDALAQLDVIEADMAKQNEALNSRLRAMYKKGDVGFLDVLLGSSSITELMTNIDRVQRVYEADQKMLEQLEEEHKVIRQQRDYLQGLQAELQANKSLEARKKSALENDKAQVNEKKAAVEGDIKALEKQIDSLNAEANRITSEILKLQGNQAFVGGDFTWPVPGVSRITSPYGYRIHPILKYKKLHTGMDIGCKSGSTVVASNSGTVIKAAWNNSYGYMVVIDHGGGIVTLYAHNSELLVKTGDIVTKGSAIAKSGSTGDSTGPHCHFEVRVNGQYVDPAGYVKYGI